jgi:hypothetical protein
VRTPALTAGDVESEVAVPSFLRASPRGFGARHGAATSSVSDWEEHTMDEQDTVVLDRPRRGRHRLPASSLRQAVSRLPLRAAAVLLTFGLCVLAAVATALAGAPLVDLGGIPAPRPARETGAGPTSGRGAGTGARTVAEPTASDADVPDPVADVGVTLADPIPVAPAAPAPTDGPAPDDGADSPPVSGVSPGDPCPAEGTAGITAGGKPTVCTRRGDGRARWRTS